MLPAFTKITSVCHVGLHIAHKGSFGNLSDRQNISYGKSSLGSAVDVLARVHALSGEEVLLVLFETIRVSEGHVGHWGASSTVMDDLFDNSSDITISLGVIQVSELRLSHTEMAVCFENTLLVTSSLTSNNSTHFSII